VAETRSCEHCGVTFTPRREHARFCSARCRVAWNRANSHDPADAVSALQWSVTAMSDMTSRLPKVSGLDKSRALAIIGESVWLVTIVDATLVRHHPEAYDCVLAGSKPAERELIEGTLAGLRFVRNRLGDDADLADLVRAADGDRGAGVKGVARWDWRPAHQPDLDSLSPRGQEWEMARYRAYQDRLAGRTVCETFGRAASFLREAAAKAALGDALPESEDGRPASDVAPR
jgi:hypothetical protein